MKPAVAKRYAKALFDQSSETGDLERVRGELDYVRHLIDNSPELAQMLDNPRISAADKDQIFRRMFRDPEAATLRFMRFLASKYRTAVLPEICDTFADMHDEAKGILKVHVTSALPLQDHQMQALLQKLGTKYEKQIALTADVDESLIGGFKLKIGDEITDFSIANKLEKFRLKVINF